MQSKTNLFVGGHAGRCLLATVLCLTAAGCFDADAMIDQRRAIAIRARLEEIDLGQFRVTLPQPAPHAQVAEIQFHVFGQVANSDLKLVEEALEENSPQLKHRLLLAAREMEMSQIEDPDLTQLRTRIIEVVNDLIPGDPIQSVGFYRFGYSNF